MLIQIVLKKLLIQDCLNLVLIKHLQTIVLPHFQQKFNSYLFMNVNKLRLKFQTYSREDI